jgi:L-serine dehydratase
MEVSRQMRGACALMVLESDQPVDETAVVEVAKAPGVSGVRVVPAV